MPGQCAAAGEAPEEGAVFRQRSRWCKGHIQVRHLVCSSSFCTLHSVHTVEHQHVANVQMQLGACTTVIVTVMAHQHSTRPKLAEDIFQACFRCSLCSHAYEPIWKSGVQALFSGENPLLQRQLSWKLKVFYTMGTMSYICAAFTVPLFVLVPVIAVTSGAFPLSLNASFAAVFPFYFALLHAGEPAAACVPSVQLASTISAALPGSLVCASTWMITVPHMTCRLSGKSAVISHAYFTFSCTRTS